VSLLLFVPKGESQSVRHVAERTQRMQTDLLPDPFRGLLVALAEVVAGHAGVEVVNVVLLGALVFERGKKGRESVSERF